MIGAIIQARMGSTRLPGKVLMDLGGRPVLRVVLDRIAAVRQIERIAVITSREPQDDVIADACRRWGHYCYRGSEQDVLDRYYRACALLKLTAVVRITADCPLHDPTVIARTLQLFTESKADYTSNVFNERGAEERTFPDGLDVEVASVKALELAWEAAADPFEREHVMPYIWRRPRLPETEPSPEEHRFTLTCLRAPDNYGHLRWTLDTAEDLERIRALVARHGPYTTDYRRLL